MNGIQTIEQYERTKAWAQRFREALEVTTATDAMLPWQRMILRDAIRSQLNDLCADIEAWEVEHAEPT